MDLKLAGKVTVVTGASKGIEGVTAVAIDLAAPEAPAQLVQRALDAYGRSDVVVNNAGAIRLCLDGFLGTSDDEFAWSMPINFFIALRSIRAALPPMIAQGGGSIVSIASVHAFFHSDAGVIDYGAARAALVNLTKARSPEFEPKGVRVNTISPGRSAPISGWACMASRRPSRPRPALTLTPLERRLWRGWAGSQLAASRLRKRSRPWSPCSRPSAPPTSPARTTSSTAV
jgi:NAD(P)-dependent dehydrogenase (short-subunit alcohol dehydrogenase family)